MTKKANRKAADTCTVTFLLMDIEGSTALHESYPDRMYTARERDDENER